MTENIQLNETESKRLAAIADRIFDTALIKAAIDSRLEEYETLVGLWDAAVADGVSVHDLEKLIEAGSRILGGKGSAKQEKSAMPVNPRVDR